LTACCGGGDVYEANAPSLPQRSRATRLLKLSEAARSLLGDVLVDHYVRTREWEVRQYQRAVTDWERERYFEII
jgi:glutamine synthetase